MSAEKSTNAPPLLEDQGPLANLRYDLPASLVVFLVALPLCLGIALASGAPLLSGIIAGVIGGIVVGVLSGSPLAVSGPAAGLTVIVLSSIESLGGYEIFLAAVVISGVIQIVLGFVRAGIFAYYIPNSVIKGMLAAIGIILILKQIPHAVGYSKDYEGDMDFFQADGRNTFSEIPYALGHLHKGAIVISLVGLALLILWTKVDVLKKQKLIPGPLAVVLVGLLLNVVFRAIAPEFAVNGELLVSLPDGGLSELLDGIRFPSLSAFTSAATFKVAFTLAAVASIETLLCTEATDKMDPFKRVTSANRELKAQGVGNLLSGLVGGIPMTAVIVRSSANIQSGGRTRMSAILHGVWLLLAVVLLPGVLNLIPLAALAAVLLHVGYKLSPVELFKKMIKQPVDQSAPFLITVGAILFTDLLTGVTIGLAVGVFFILKTNLQFPFFVHQRAESGESGKTHIRLELSEHVSFLNKASVNAVLYGLPRNSVVEIDGSSSAYIDHDVIEFIKDFKVNAAHRGIDLVLKNIPGPDEHQSSREATKRRPNPGSLSEMSSPGSTG